MPSPLATACIPTPHIYHPHVAQGGVPAHTNALYMYNEPLDGSKAGARQNSPCAQPSAASLCLGPGVGQTPGPQDLMGPPYGAEPRNSWARLMVEFVYKAQTQRS